MGSSPDGSVSDTPPRACVIRCPNNSLPDTHQKAQVQTKHDCTCRRLYASSSCLLTPSGTNISVRSSFCHIFGVNNKLLACLFLGPQLFVDYLQPLDDLLVAQGEQGQVLSSWRVAEVEETGLQALYQSTCQLLPWLISISLPISRSFITVHLSVSTLLPCSLPCMGFLKPCSDAGSMQI